MSGAANAQAWYAEARKRDRAAERLPALIEANRQTVAALEDRLQRARAGEAIELPAQPSKPGQRRVEQKLPYRRYRTSGGLEVRVGRNSRANDELTLRHAAPDDIWMHARAAGGAHVVLRWSDPDANPPRRDLEQAAMLAALHSKARHSGVVPVDWTRRKYVRKPRKAAAGSVSVERVKTLFVRPENDQLNELRWTE
jgi:predicted ribosome quality control (RQC) complex YloA/Tae2 family protein